MTTSRGREAAFSLGGTTSVAWYRRREAACLGEMNSPQGGSLEALPRRERWRHVCLAASVGPHSHRWVFSIYRCRSADIRTTAPGVWRDFFAQSKALMHKASLPNQGRSPILSLTSHLSLSLSFSLSSFEGGEKGGERRRVGVAAGVSPTS